jgi:ligand-binding SRPBCC domain-containing protein
MKFQRSFEVLAPVEKVVSFHQSARSLKAITPPFFFMSGIQAPEYLSEADDMAFTLWMGPIPVRWEARIENVTEAGFDDVQRHGPFQTWIHAHRFEAKAAEQTLVHDEIEYRLRKHWFWGPIGLMMSLGLPLLFWYRSRKTKDLLERSD